MNYDFSRTGKQHKYFHKLPWSWWLNTAAKKATHTIAQSHTCLPSQHTHMHAKITLEIKVVIVITVANCKAKDLQREAPEFVFGRTPLVVSVCFESGHLQLCVYPYYRKYQCEKMRVISTTLFALSSFFPSPAFHLSLSSGISKIFCWSTLTYDSSQILSTQPTAKPINHLN